jgi:hypothetical protein
LIVTDRMTIETSNLSSIEENSQFDDAVTLGLNKIEEIIDQTLRNMDDDRLNQSMVSARSSLNESTHSGPITSKSCVS